MSKPDWNSLYDSHADFYQDVYAQHVTEVRPIGPTSAVMLEAKQAAGDWSDAATPDLVIGTLPSRPVAVTMDLGAGRFRAVQQTSDCILIAPGASSSILMDGGHICRLLAVPYHSFFALAEERGAGLPFDGDFGRLHAGLFRHPALTSTLDHLWQESGTGGAHGALFTDGALLQIASILLRLRDSATLPALARGGLAAWQVKRVCDYLLAHLDEDVSLDVLARLLDLSPAHFCRAFKQSTGLPPHAWLLQRRIERAQELMAAHPRMGLTEVAQSVGYGGQSAFGTAFRRVTGTTPSAWRRERLL
jgi:AraC family transcriptional regulator